jgi:heme exporter protein B
MNAVFYNLFKHELRSEFRNKSALGAIFLYNTASYYLVSQLYQQNITPLSWAAVFIIIQLFGAINAVTKSFVAEANGRVAYYAQLASGTTILVAKTLANFVLLIVLSLVSLILSLVFFGNFVADVPLFVLTQVLMSLFWACMLTFLSSIAMKTNNGNVVMAIISLPMLIPFSGISMKLFKICMDDLGWYVGAKYVGLLLALIIAIEALGLLLFRYIWKD